MKEEDGPCEDVQQRKECGVEVEQQEGGGVEVEQQEGGGVEVEQQEGGGMKHKQDQRKEEIKERKVDIISNLAINSDTLIGLIFNNILEEVVQGKVCEKLQKSIICNLAIKNCMSVCLSVCMSVCLSLCLFNSLTD